MRLRTRLTLYLLALLLIVIGVISSLALEISVGMATDGLFNSAELMSDQIYEQMRLALAKNTADPLIGMRTSAALRALLDSTRAFGPGVVSASIISPDGIVIVAAGREGEGLPAPHIRPIEKLRHSIGRFGFVTAISRFWNAEVYEMRMPVEANGRPLASISVGITTALIADQVRRLVLTISLAAALAAVLAWIAATIIANWILKQISHLAQGFESLAEGTSRVPISGQDELSTLAERFNQLSHRLQSDRSQLAGNRDHLFDVVRSIQDAVVLLDPSGVVLFANKEAQEKLSANAETLEGKLFGEVLGPNHPLVGLAASTIETGTEAHDVPVDLPGGLSFLVSFSRLGRGRTPAGLLIVLRDMEPVLALETALDYSKQLARLGGLISGVAHQLRSPLHGMNLRLELMRSDRGESKDRHIDRLRQEVERLDQAVEALLRFMRPEDLKLSEFAANELLRAAGGRITGNMVRVEYHLATDLPLVSADRPMIAEALLNIVSNAVQAMPNGGVLSLTSSSSSSTVELMIADQGVGIAQDKLDKIFDLYYTTKPSGSGLGLSLALRAVQLNRGNVRVESRVGDGTIVRIILPIAAHQANAALVANG